MNDKQVEYYERRAHQYEKIYLRKERQTDQEKLKIFLSNLCKAKSVLEIGCGTGYWSKYISESAKSLLATDINPSMLDLATQKKYTCPSSFRKVDYKDLHKLEANFDMLVGAFVISHIKKENLKEFLYSVSQKLDGVGEMVFIDNVFVEGNSTPISRTDIKGNTYQRRKLEDGSSYEVLKNFFTLEEWKIALQSLGEFEIKELNYFFLIHIKMSL